MSADRELWAAVVAARQNLVRASADFYHQAEARREALASALGGSSHWDCGAALFFLQEISDDVPDLLEQLVELASTSRWALTARRAIEAGRREEVVRRLRQIVESPLEGVDAEYWGGLAEVLRALKQDELLRLLVEKATRSDDPEVRELAGNYQQE